MFSKEQVFMMRVTVARECYPIFLAPVYTVQVRDAADSRIVTDEPIDQDRLEIDAAFAARRAVAAADALLQALGIKG